jgi:hypothetical protein
VLLLLVSSVRVLSAALAELRITAKASPAQTTDLPTSLPG